MSSTSSSSIPKDVVIIGGGLAGLSAALHIATSTTTNRREVTVVDAMPKSQDISKSTSGSFAAAGMLAPQSIILHGVIMKAIIYCITRLP